MKAKTYRNESAADEIERVVQGAAKRNEGWRMVVVRLTPAEHRALRVKAAQDETTVSDMVRAMARALMAKEK